jgi:ABC-type histidine transport system ATPase subunit
MGSCGSSNRQTQEPPAAGGTLVVMFRRLDKDNKGYISIKDLKVMMKDDKTHFQGRDAEHIMNKFGTNGTMSFEQFTHWWGSTYTTYADEGILQDLVDEVDADNEHLEVITEVSEGAPSSQRVISRS